jgi:hypothetical protein
MAIVDLGTAEPVVAEPTARRPRSLRPNWSTSAVPWIVTGAIWLAVVVTAIVTFSIRATEATINQQRGSLIQSCINSGGTAPGCQSVANGSQTTTGTGSSTDGSSLSSISS